jgi:hypothetical protein
MQLGLRLFEFLFKFDLAVGFATHQANGEQAKYKEKSLANPIRCIRVQKLCVNQRQRQVP